MTASALPFLISIHPQYVQAILTGDKIVECRKSSIGLAPGDLLYLYATAPVKAILGTARVVQLHKGSPADLWRRHANSTCVREVDFETYYRGATSAVFIGLAEVQRLEKPIPLSALRRYQDKFSPPQTARRLGAVFPPLRVMLTQELELELES